MIQLIRNTQHHRSAHSWLTSFHHFSFDQYYDPTNMNWGKLRVFNEDFISPASGFPLHPHHDMEIVTYVLSGELKHEDSLGNSGIIHAGEIQYMSAGTGVLHAEFNASKTHPLHLIQMWVLPEKEGLTPSWGQQTVSREEKMNRLLCVVSKKKSDAIMRIHQDASFHVSILMKGKKIEWKPEYSHQYLFVIDGSIRVNGATINKQDSAKIMEEKQLTIEGLENAHFVLWDMAE